MKIKFFILLLCIIAGIAIYTYQNSLGKNLYKLTADKNCEVGIAVIHDKDYWSLNNDETYPLMSVFKIFVAAAVLDKTEKENTALNSPILISQDMIYQTYSPLRDKIKKYPYQSTIEELLFYMLAQSDNIATDVLISYLGGIDNLNQFISSAGFPQIVIKANEKQMSQDIQNQKLNVAQPQDIALFLKAIDDGKILSLKQANVFRNILKQTQTGQNKLKAGLPNDAVIGHKTGSSDRDENSVKIGDNDAGFVILPNGEIYYIVVLIKNSKMSDDQNANLIAQVSKLVYEKLK